MKRSSEKASTFSVGELVIVLIPERNRNIEHVARIEAVIKERGLYRCRFKYDDLPTSGWYKASQIKAIPDGRR